MSKKYSNEYKAEAVKLVLEMGMSANQASKDLGVSQTAMSRWVRQEKARRADPSLPTADELDELKKLRKENTILKAERDFLKQAAVFFAKEKSK